MQCLIPFLSCAFIILSSIVINAYSYRPINAHKQWFRYPGNPGIKIRLTKKGANHVKSVGVQIFNDYISELKDYSTTVPFSQLGLNGNVHLKKLHIKTYHPPQLSVLNFFPPNHIILGLENLAMSMGSQFTADSPPFKIEGSLDGSMAGMTIALTTELITDIQGRMNAVVRNCSALVSRTHVTLNPTGPMAIFVKPFEPMINDSVKKRIPEILCERLQQLIEKNIVKMFDQISRIDLQDYFPKMTKKEKDVMSLFVSQLANGMFVDNRMITQPLITMDYIETNHLGEIRFENHTEAAPFYPKPMEFSDEPVNLDNNSMAQFYISDHLLNSMLYHAYQDNRLSIRMDEGNLPNEMKSFVATSCPTKRHPSIVCVGSLIPQIGASFPNSTTSFVILPHGLPYVMFNTEATAIELTNRVLTYVQPEDDPTGRNKTQVLVFSITGQADLHFNPTNDSLNARMTLNRFNVRLHRSSVRGIDESSISRLSPLSKTFIGPRLNTAVEKAAKFPMQETVKFINPKIQNYNGFIVLTTDFKLDKTKISKIVRKSLEL